MIANPYNGVSERVHTRYDAELGWANIPSLHVPDLYGPGVYLATNTQGFRNNADFSPLAPKGKLRIICSGDSFTLGWGVSNDETWCELLAGGETRFESVNMGQGGYGFDQAYLWYMRDGVKLEHHVHIMAFIVPDLRRMQYSRFLGFPKPMLRLRDGDLVTTHVPVPRAHYRVPWLTANFQLLGNLQTTILARYLWRKAWRAQDAPGTEMDEDEARQVVLKVFEKLKTLHNREARVFLAVLLPTSGDALDPFNDRWRTLLRRELAERNIRLLDLIAALRHEPAETIPSYFRLDHNSSAGHRWVAQHVKAALLEAPLPEPRGRVAAVMDAPR